jgi:hypothetical protein
LPAGEMAFCFSREATAGALGRAFILHRMYCSVAEVCRGSENSGKRALKVAARGRTLADVTNFHIGLRFSEGAAAIRERTLGALVAQAAAVERRYTELPGAAIPSSPEQYRSVVRDAEVLPSIKEAVERLMSLQEFAWDNPGDLGGPIRKRFRDVIAQSSEVADRVAALAEFQPPTGLDKARQWVIEAGGQQAMLTLTLLRAVIAAQPEEFEDLAKRVSDLLGSWPMVENLAELLEQDERWFDVGDIGKRIDAALGVTGAFVDDYGIPNDEALVHAFAGEADPLAAAGTAAARYLADLVGGEPQEATGAVLLVPAARQLAVLDRPLPALRIARRARQLLREAADTNENATQVEIERLFEDGWRLQETQQRIRRQLVQWAGGDPGEADAADLLMDLYRRLAESGYRVYDDG